MRFLFFLFAIALHMTASSSEADQSLSPVKVEVVATEDGYALLRDGEPTLVIGTPGGFRTGPWDPTRMGEVLELAVDGVVLKGSER